MLARATEFHNQERWMPPLSQREGEQEWVFLRLYDFNADGTITFSVITLRRAQTLRVSNQTLRVCDWQQQVESTQLYPWRQAELLAALEEGGWTDVVCRGDMGGGSADGGPFVADSSPNLVIGARSGW